MSWTVRRSLMRRFPSCHAVIFAIAGLLYIGVSACGFDAKDRDSFYSDGCVLETEAAACDDCLHFNHLARLGDVDGTGYLTSTTMSAVVRDHRSHYWVGQGTGINIYDPVGAFVTRRRISPHGVIWRSMSTEMCLWRIVTTTSSKHGPRVDRFLEGSRAFRPLTMVFERAPESMIGTTLFGTLSRTSILMPTASYGCS